MSFNLDKILKDILLTPGTGFFYTPPIYKNAISYLFKGNPKIFSIKKSNIADFYNLKSEVENKIGFFLINYEFGYILENKLFHLVNNDKVLFQFYAFDKKECKKFDSNKITINNEVNNFSIEDISVNTSLTEYGNAIKKIKTFIKNGDTYQVNYTVKAKFKINGDLISLFQTLIFNQSAEFTAIINTGDNIIISISPELFFKIEGRTITTKPMKGTIQRGYNQFEDIRNFSSLKNSIKDRAENVMIVDMLRNDLGKISKYGSVKATKLFEIEKYESVFQMTSTIKGKLNKNDLIDVIANLFPCGSITGAPKIRTMEIIHSIEKEERGIYTGSIGIKTNDKSVFNVAIRTIVIDKKGNAEMGLGSGVVWDSKAISEYEESILKGNFLFKSENPFYLFESILYEKGKFFLLNTHINRLIKSAERFLFVADKKKILNALKNESFKLSKSKSYKIKLILNKQGKIDIITEKLKTANNKLKVLISSERINSTSLFQYHKTSNRKLYDKVYHEIIAKGFDEAIFLNEKDELCEGIISNIVIEKNGQMFTPKEDSGLLPGVFREFLISKGVIKEKSLFLKDIKTADKIFLINSVRKFREVEKIFNNENGILFQIKWTSQVS